MGLDIYFNKRPRHIPDTAKKAKDLRDRIKAIENDERFDPILELLKKQEITREEYYNRAQDILIENAGKMQALLDTEVVPFLKEHFEGFQQWEEDSMHVLVELTQKFLESDLTDPTDSYEPIFLAKKDLTEVYEKLLPETEVAYFRGCNLIMQYFGYEENCSDMPITKEQIQGLIDRAKTVFARQFEDDFEEFAKRTLPNCWDQYGYGDDYIQNLSVIIKRLKTVVEEFDPECDYFLHCWW